MQWKWCTIRRLWIWPYSIVMVDVAIDCWMISIECVDICVSPMIWISRRLVKVWYGKKICLRSNHQNGHWRSLIILQVRFVHSDDPIAIDDGLCLCKKNDAADGEDEAIGNWTSEAYNKKELQFARHNVGCDGNCVCVLCVWCDQTCWSHIIACLLVANVNDRRWVVGMWMLFGLCQLVSFFFFWPNLSFPFLSFFFSRRLLLLPMRSLKMPSSNKDQQTLCVGLSFVVVFFCFIWVSPMEEIGK